VTPMASNDEDRTRRAELVKELGFFPATLDSVDIERHRRLNAALDAVPTREQIARKYAHLREEHRRIEVEARRRRELADLNAEDDNDDR
jgi:hypothetical protein